MAASDVLNALVAADPELTAATRTVDLRTFDLHHPSAGDDLAGPPERAGAVLHKLRAATRVSRVAPDATVAARMLGAGLHSAQHVAIMPEHRFVREHAGLFDGDSDAARAAHRRAVGVRNLVQHLHANLLDVASPHLAAVRSSPVTAELRNYQELFGSLDGPACDDCASIFGPAAYLFDLLRVTEDHITDVNPPLADDARLAKWTLRARRPDLFSLPLTCGSTTTEEPTLDVVAAVVARRVADELPAADLSAEDLTYRAMAVAPYPFGLPWNLPLERVRRALGVLGTSLAAVHREFTDPASVDTATAREELGLSVEQAAMLVTRRAAPELAPCFGQGTLDLDALARVATFRRTTGLTRPALVALLTQGLSSAELAGEPVTQLFVNATGEAAAPMRIVVDATDPNAPFERIANLTAARLDRLNRFVRLVTALGWSAEELDWALRSTGAQEIDDDALVRLAAIRALVRETGLGVLELCAFWADMKTTGHGDGPHPADLFSRTFNAPAMLAGADPYTSVETIPFDPGRPLVWNVAATSASDLAIRGRLRAALGVSDDDLTLLAGFTAAQLGPTAAQPGPTAAQPGPTTDSPVLTLTVTALSRLYRLAAGARAEGLPIDQSLLLQRLRLFPDQALPSAATLVPTVDAVTAQRESAAWLTASPFTAWALDYVVTGERTPGFRPPYETDSIATLTAGLATAAAPARITPGALSGAGLDARTAGRLHAELVASELITPNGIGLPGTSQFTETARAFPLTPDDLVGGPLTAGDAGTAFDALVHATPPLLAAEPGAARSATLSPAFTGDTDLGFLFVGRDGAPVLRAQVAAVLSETRQRIVAGELTPRLPVTAADLVSPAVDAVTAGRALADLMDLPQPIVERVPGPVEARIVTGYDAATRTATIDVPWSSVPQPGAPYVVVAPVLSGTAQGGDLSGIDLDAKASADNGAYTGMRIELRAGDGPGQSARIVGYDGTRRHAQVTPPWATAPRAGTQYTVTTVVDTGHARSTDTTWLQLDGAAPQAIGDYEQPTLHLVDHGVLRPGFTAPAPDDLGSLLASTGTGQSRTISSYDGATRTATVAPAWDVPPDATSYYRVTRSSHSGTTARATSGTIVLAGTATADDHAYTGMTVTITGGTGAGHTATVTGYAGPTRTATLARPWAVVPDATSTYEVADVVATGPARGGTADTVLLAPDAAVDDSYASMTVSLVPAPETDSQRAGIVRSLQARQAAIVDVAATLTTLADTQHGVALQGIADAIGCSAPRLAAVVPVATGRPDLRANLPDLLDAPVGEPAPDAVGQILDRLARSHVLFEQLGIPVPLIRGLAELPGAFGVGEVGPLTLPFVRAVSAVAALTRVLGDGAALVDYLRPPSGPDRAAALGALTGWPATQISQLTALLQPDGPGGDGNAPGTVAGITALRTRFDLIARTGLDVTSLCSLADLAVRGVGADGHVDPQAWTTYDHAATLAVGAVNARFAGQDLTAVNAALVDGLNEVRNTALTGYAVHVLGDVLEPPSLRSLSEYLLIDVQTGSCARTSPVAQGISAVQLYHQRCRLRLEPGVRDLSTIPDTWWDWLSAYRVWEANRRVFLHPENYLRPGARRDATPAFDDLATALQQTHLTDRTAADALGGYLDALDTVSNLVIVGAHETRVGTSDRLVLVGRTAAEPSVYYQRTLDSDGGWSPWSEVPVTIPAPLAAPVLAFGRMMLFWAELKKIDRSQITSGATGTGPRSETQTSHSATVRYSFQRPDGTWSVPQTAIENGVFNYETGFRRAQYLSDVLQDKASYLDRSLVIWHKPYPLFVPGDRIPRDLGRLSGDQIVLVHGFTDPFTPSPPYDVGDEPDALVDPDRRQVEANTHRLDVQFNGLNGLANAGWTFLQNGGACPLIPSVAFGAALNSTVVNLVLLHCTSEQSTPYVPVLDRTGGTLGIATSATGNVFLDDFYCDDHPGLTMPNRPTVDVPLLFGVADTLSSVTAVTNRPGSFVFDNGDESFLVRTSDQQLSTLSRTMTCSTGSPNDAELGVSVFVHPPDGAYLTPDAVTWHFTRTSTDAGRQLAALLAHGGVPGLLTVEAQRTREAPFSRFQPSPQVTGPTDELDFDGAYGPYFWELFFHAPFLVADTLGAQQRFEQAKTWLEYVFDPTSRPDPWRFLPFGHMTRDTLARTLADPAQITAYNDDPLDPDAIARLRIAAYAKAVVIRYVTNVLDWADSLFTEDTRETIDQATNLYFLAADLLGPRPETTGSVAAPAPASFDDIAAGYHERVLEDWVVITATAATVQLDPGASRIDDAYTGFQAVIDNTGESCTVVAYDGATRTATVEPAWVTIPSPASSRCRIVASGVPQFLLRVESSTLMHDRTTVASAPYVDLSTYFCVPENDQLVGLWDRVEDRLYKIRNCMDITGRVQQLPLFAPPLDPAALIAGRGAGGGAAAGAQVPTPVPNYRFTTLLDRARGMAAAVSQLGTSLLGALERRDSETLALLQTSQQRQVLDLMTVIKEQQVEEATRTRDALAASLASARFRADHYAGLVKAGLSTAEIVNIKSMASATVFNIAGSAVKTASAIGYAVPQVGSPFAMTYGGAQLGAALTAASGVFDGLATLANFGAQLSITLAQYQRREAEWTMQQTLATHDIEQIVANQAAAAARLTMAEQDLATHRATLAQHADIEQFLTGKFGNRELYQWMATRLSTLNFQAYSIALDLARSAQSAYRYELGSDATFVGAGTWDDARSGLLAGDGLMLALHRMDQSYLEQNSRPLEIEKTISLLQVDPRAVLDLVATGTCVFTLPEKLFDDDYPGHYARRIRSLAVSVPALTGPYQNLHATLTQLTDHIVLAPDRDAVNYLLGTPDAPTPGPSVLRTGWRADQQIALSSGVSDTGTLAPPAADDRYLPFEGTGAVSTWRLDMPRQTNRFDFESISDVVLTLNYTARDGGAAFRSQVVGLPPMRTTYGSVFLPLAQRYSTEWYAFLHGPPPAERQTLTFTMSDLVPPHVGGATLTGLFLQLDVPPGTSTSGSGKYLHLSLGSSAVDLTFAPDEQGGYTYLFPTPPRISDVEEGASTLDVVLKSAPADLLAEGSALDASVVRNAVLILFYEGQVGW